MIDQGIIDGPELKEREDQDNRYTYRGGIMSFRPNREKMLQRRGNLPYGAEGNLGITAMSKTNDQSWFKNIFQGAPPPRPFRREGRPLRSNL
jgi:hypothetical protein